MGTNTDCGRAICCRQENGYPQSADQAAGLYGELHCGTPLVTYDALLDHALIRHGEELEMIFLTGDLVHSAIWLYSVEENRRHIETVTQKLIQRFPNTPIYPVSGNHDVQVCNMYTPSELWDEENQRFYISWMYDTISNPFTKWLGSDQLATFRKGGYYTVKPPNQRNLRLVILNTNLCYVDNYWLVYNPIDPQGQLQWLADVLLQAEKDSEIVYIVGHISPGTDFCWSVWSEKFNEIISRFEGIIKALWYGHTHEDYFQISFEKGTGRPSNVNFLGPSLWTDFGNSAYSIYKVDGVRGADSTWEVLDQETWILNTAKSNQDSSPVIEKLYSAKDEYELESLRGNALYGFLMRMMTNDTLFLQFQWNRLKGMSGTRSCSLSDPNFLDCKFEKLCDCVKEFFDPDDLQCKKLQNMMLDKR